MWGPLLCLGAPMLHDGPRRSYPQHGLLLAESVSNRNMCIHYSVMIMKKNAIKTKNWTVFGEIQTPSAILNTSLTRFRLF